MTENRPIDLQTKPDGYYSQRKDVMLDFVPVAARTVLDIGCSEGHFGALLRERNGAEVWGIELETSAARSAEARLDRVLCGDALALLDHLPPGFFDAIICNDVLEHLVDPYSLLVRVREKLSPQGCIVASIPNIRYLPVLRDFLLKKQWRYEAWGVMDKTHLRFFTRNSIVEMFSDHGYRIETIAGINPMTTWKFDLVNWLSLGYLADTRYMQFAVVARPK